MGRQVKEPPGRPREFDREMVLAQATDVFWQQGFAKTTYADLEQATGLHRQSLVYAFGDKKALFQAALNHYAATQVQDIIEQITAPGSPIANLRSLLDAWTEEAEQEITRGCLFVNTSGELGQGEPAFIQVIDSTNERVVQALQKTIQAGQEQGEIVSYLDATDLAQQILAVGDGVLLRSRVSRDASFARAVFRSLLASIEC